MLTRRIVAPFDGALLGEAPPALQEELDAFAPALPAHCHVISCQALSLLLDAPPLGRPAAVVRNRGDVSNRRDLQPDRLQRSDGSLTARPRTPDVDFHLLQPELHCLARRVLRGRLGRERRALSRALEPGASCARPGHDVAHLIGERDDGVVEGRLHVGDAHTDLLALASPPALSRGRGRFLFLGVSHACASSLLRRRSSRRRGRHWLLLDHDTLAAPLPGARVRMGALSADGQALAVTDATVAADVHQPLDAHRHLAAQVALHLVLALEDVPQAPGLIVAPVLHALARIHARLDEEPLGGRRPDPVDVLNRDLPTLVPRQVDPGDACHGNSSSLVLALTLFVARVLADDAHGALTAHDLAVLAPHLDGRPRLHRCPLT